MKFTHLHCHSQYSLLDGASNISKLVSHVKKNGMEHIAVTDHGNMHSSVELIRECRKKDIIPICGIEAYTSPFSRFDKTPGGKSGKEHYFHLTLLAKNGVGLKNLFKMSSLGYTDGYYYKPRIDKEVIKDCSEGVICLSGCVSSEWSDYIINEDYYAAKELADFYLSVFGDNFYIEIQNNNVDIQLDHMRKAKDFAVKNGIPLVATSDAHYISKEDSVMHDVLLCINTKKKLADENRMKFSSNEFHVRSPEEMVKAFPGDEDAVCLSYEIGQSIEPYYETAEIGKRQFPSFDCGNEVSEFRKRATRGLANRGKYDKKYTDRLEKEIRIITKMGFSSYFLIVSDIVDFANQNEIFCSARGSACGSLVAYSLRITDVDPILHDLLFERFLDPQRSEPPDIDIDVCQERREELIEYVKSKYGRDRVAQIATFGTLGAKNAIKDIARVMDYGDANPITKKIPPTPGITIKSAIDSVDDFREIYAKNEEKKIIDMAIEIEGIPRNCSTHAAGVVISPKKLEDSLPVMIIPKNGNNKDLVTQWQMKDIEAAGFLKIDLLGLRNLTVLSECQKLIRKKNPGFDVSKIPFDDEETYEMLRDGETHGVFQLASDGIKKLLVRLKPDKFNDIMAVAALYRPGPLEGGMVDDYVSRKNKVTSYCEENPIIDSVLSETYGVMVYQEQIMKILNLLGGIPLTKAYRVIKNISKKNTEEISKNRSEFVRGCKKGGVSEDQANEIFDKIEVFGGYGFNKSHSCAYAILAYRTAFVKKHFPQEFMCCLLSSDMGAQSRDRFIEHINECSKLNIKILPIDVNVSDERFTIDSMGRIVYGLGAIKGVPESSIKECIANRTSPYSDMYDFIHRNNITESACRKMASVGAFDAISPSRASACVSVPMCFSRKKNYVAGQSMLFQEMNDGHCDYIVLPEIPLRQKLDIEKSLTGFWMSGNPVDEYLKIFGDIRNCRAKDMKDGRSGTSVMIGVVTNIEVKTVKTERKLNKACFFDLTDETGTVNFVAWPEKYDAYRRLLLDNSVVIVYTKVGSSDRTCCVDKICTPATIGKEGYHIFVSSVAGFSNIIQCSKKFPGKSRVFITEPMLSGSYKIYDTGILSDPAGFCPSIGTQHVRLTR